MKKQPARVMIGDTPVYGTTRAQAKALAAEQIETAFTGSYRPSLIEYRGNQAIIWRERLEWNYAVIWSDLQGDGDWTARACDQTGFESRAEAIDRAYHHLIQAGWVREDGDTVPACITDPEIREGLVRWQQWQMRWADARAAGSSDDEARLIADGRRAA